MDTLKEVFDHHFQKVKFDAKLAKEVYQFQIGFVNANREHMEFFGGNLLGVQIVRFKDRDIDRFFNDVLDVDFDKLKTSIRKLDTIDHSFKISGDIMNLTCMYVIHRFMKAPTISEQQRKRAAHDVALIFFYRCVVALICAYFQYPADPKIAQAAYSRLSNKFLIKRLGSWHKVMDYRATELLDPHSGIHVDALLKFTNDDDIVYCINDSQGRVRDLIKGYYGEFAKAHAEGASVATTAGTYMDPEGEETIKEKTKSVENYVTYIHQSLSDERTFIKNELIDVIVKINTNTSFRMVKATLQWMYEKQNDPKYHDEIHDFISAVIVQSLHLIQHSMQARNMRDYPYILSSLKNLYLSTRSTDENLEYVRELGYRLIKDSNPKGSDSLILATRTSVILYLTLRALVGQNAN